MYTTLHYMPKMKPTVPDPSFFIYISLSPNLTRFGGEGRGREEGFVLYHSASRSWVGYKVISNRIHTSAPTNYLLPGDGVEGDG